MTLPKRPRSPVSLAHCRPSRKLDDAQIRAGAAAPDRGRGAHIKSVKNKTGILTIALDGGRTVRYDGLHGKFVP